MPEPEAAVAIVHAREPEDTVLLMRRAERKEDSWSGHWSFPGGRRDASDIDPLHTALRELEEECGIRLRSADLETAMPPRLARRAAGPYLLVAPFVLRSAERLATVLDATEAAEAVWAPLHLLRDRARHSLQPVPGRPAEMYFPALTLSGTPLWGFTYRLLMDWLGFTPPEPPVERAGFAVADAILEFVVAQGLSLRHGWRPDEAGGAEAAVDGVLPAAAVAERFCRPGLHVDTLNLLELRPHAIRLVGPEFEEYVVRAAG